MFKFEYRGLAYVFQIWRAFDPNFTDNGNPPKRRKPDPESGEPAGISTLDSPMPALAECLTTANCQPVPLADVPVLGLDEFSEQLAIGWQGNASGLSALFGVPRTDQSVRLYAVTSHRMTGQLRVMAVDVGERYPALTADIPQAHWFEREIAEQWGVVPEGHPWLKPIRSHHSYVRSRDAWGRSHDDPILPCVQPPGTDYFKAFQSVPDTSWEGTGLASLFAENAVLAPDFVLSARFCYTSSLVVTGDEIHEVGVGPVHAGVIEPGHFRFYTASNSFYAERSSRPASTTRKPPSDSASPESRPTVCQAQSRRPILRRLCSSGVR